MVISIPSVTLALTFIFLRSNFRNLVIFPDNLKATKKLKTNSNLVCSIKLTAVMSGFVIGVTLMKQFKEMSVHTVSQTYIETSLIRFVKMQSTTTVEILMH